jgi:CRP-like cAMP-binding protein
MFGLDALLNVANVVYLASYSVRDILWLRILTVFGASLLLPYYYLQIEPLYAAMAWNLVFIAINIFWITKLLLERRPVQFTDEERRLYQSSLRNMSERDAFKLLRMGHWTTAPAGTTLVQQGGAVDTVGLISGGEVNIKVDGDQVDTLGEGRFFGPNAFLSGDDNFKAPVTIVVIEPIRMLVWQRAELQSRFAKQSDLEIAFQASLGLEIARFLKTARTQLLQVRTA